MYMGKEKESKQYINLSNLKVFWDNIKNLFASKEHVISLEERVNFLENEIKKLNSYNG